MNEYIKRWGKATAIRCARQFLAAILGIFTGGMLITEVDWKFALLSAFSSAFFIFLACCYAGLPEVDMALEDIEEIEEAEEDEDEDFTEGSETNQGV